MTPTARSARLVVVSCILIAVATSCASTSGEAKSSPQHKERATTTSVPPTTYRQLGVVIVPPSGEQPQPTLHFFGDSIIELAEDTLVARFDDRFQVGIYAVGSAASPWFADPIAKVARNAPDAVVIDLGTNDANCFDDRCVGASVIYKNPNFDADTVNARLDSFAAAFPERTCVIFVNVNTHNPSWGPKNAALINAHLATYPRVVDWDHAWQPEWFVGPDNPHPNPRGARALASLIDTQLSTCPPPVGSGR